MKKRICVMALTLALAAGGLSLASDLKLADGHILPLGNEMTLREDFPSCKWRRRMLFIRRLLYL